MWLVWVIFLVLFLFLIVVVRGAPYVPSRKSDLAVAFEELYPLGTDDLVVDIGSGDGVVLRAASSYGAKALGYEINPMLVVISRLLSIKDRRVAVRWADFWITEFPEQTTVVYTFGESRHIKRMAEKVQLEASKLKKSLYFLSYGFEIPGQKLYKQAGAYHLYRFDPLQNSEA